MRCKRIRTENLRNEEWFQLHTEFKDVVEQYTPQALKIEQPFNDFLTFYTNAGEALKIIRKNAATEQMAEADNARDSLFRGFADSVKSYHNHFDGTRREAAGRLQIILDQYGDIARMPYNQETTSINNFLQDIYIRADEVDILRLSDLASQLDTENKAFDALMKDHDDETAVSTSQHMKEVRVEADRCYCDVLDRIDALILINGEEVYAPFVKDHTVCAEQFENILAQRNKGRVKKG
ncbi:MAG: DUF6261 family protein [Bacteroidales bacterium]|jgi:hypothetical protein|nr:DUF6261 family protein [Bacteroidales bacterium]